MWRGLRQMIAKDRPPLCVECEREGRAVFGRELDHITPKRAGGTDDPENLQWLCHAHHVAKTHREKGTP